MNINLDVHSMYSSIAFDVVMQGQATKHTIILLCSVNCLRDAELDMHWRACRTPASMVEHLPCVANISRV